MNIPSRKRLQQAQLDLQSRGLSNYRAFLVTVCNTHQDTQDARCPFGITLKVLRRGKTLSKEIVSELLVLADSFKAQVHASALEHYRANQLSLLIRKVPFPKECNPYNPKKEALRKFHSSERKCARMNSFFRAYNSRYGKGRPYERLFSDMRSFISYVIGYHPTGWMDDCDFGGGASIGVHGNATNIARKIGSRWSCTPSAYEIGHAAVMENVSLREEIIPGFGGFRNGVVNSYKAFDTKVDLVAYNKLGFVPKTAKTHRSIAVEPLLNSYLQKGVDSFIRKRLKRIGIDLSDQEPNSDMARQGSLKESDPFCTIDLASASDSISIGLCKEILPPDWFYFLNNIRSPSYKLGREVIRYQKFCSMGNGFCFPLETLIFCAICSITGCGIPNQDFRVYGDDIIVRKSKFEAVVAVLKLCGFSLNKDKTFSEGPFRESCGRDWFEGVDVRPYTLDFIPVCIQDWFKILNGSLRNSLTRDFFEPLRVFLISRIPKDFQFFRPYPGPEDTGITAVADEFLLSPCVEWVTHKRLGKGVTTRYISRCWRWLELVSEPKTDFRADLASIDQPNWLAYAALRGSASAQPFTLRLTTRTNVRVISHGGATSQWLPAGAPL